MIPFKTALELVLDNARDFGTENIPIENSVGRILAEEVLAHRDFPPFHRSTKDGIAINYSVWNSGQKGFKIENIAAAGEPQKVLSTNMNCLEIMTGAVVPKGTDTVVMYEDLTIENSIATISSDIEKGQNIHYKGTDQKTGNLLLDRGHKISTASLAILATEGITDPKVKKLPQVAILTTGTEVVDIEEAPNPYQIRRSNSYTLQALLKELHIDSDLYHESDDKQRIERIVEELIANYDVLLMSGGVSMGKFDFLPAVLENLGVNQIFHRVAQRPGKPLWFGSFEDTTIFSFPGNPVSTYVNFHIYFKPWISHCLGIEHPFEHVSLPKPMDTNDLTLFKLAKISEQNEHTVELISSSGSGDLVSLSRASGVLEIPASSILKKGDLVRYIRF